MVVAVGGEEAGREAGNLCDVVQEGPGNLIKKLKDVRSPAGERNVVGAVVFEVNCGTVPCILGPNILDASKHAVELPLPDPRA